MSIDPGYRTDVTVLHEWIQAAMGPGGTTTETAAAVARAVTSLCTRFPESLISGAPNRVPGTIIWWTAEVDHAARFVTITNIEPPPQPGL